MGEGLVSNDGNIQLDKDGTRKRAINTYLANKPVWYQRLEASSGPFNETTLGFIAEVIGARVQNNWNKKKFQMPKNRDLKFIHV